MFNKTELPLLERSLMVKKENGYIKSNIIGKETRQRTILNIIKRKFKNV